MATISNGTTISFGGTAVDATDISISATSTAIDATALGYTYTTALQGRPTITGNATIHTDSATALALAGKFAGATPDTALLTVIINSAGGASGGVDFSGSAVITAFNPSWSNDAIQTAQVSWQYSSQITVSRAA